jgi:hypothetical protein
MDFRQRNAQGGNPPAFFVARRPEANRSETDSESQATAIYSSDSRNLASTL